MERVSDRYGKIERNCSTQRAVAPTEEEVVYFYPVLYEACDGRTALCGNAVNM
jgi:hypothetical protein